MIKSNSVKMILAILFFSFIAALTISSVHQKTYQIIKDNENKAEQASLRNVLSYGANAKTDTLDGFGEFWREYDKDGNAIGYAFIGETRGYSGIIRFICGIDLDGKIKGLSIISQTETPGLGARITEAASGTWFPFRRSEDNTPWFGEQFRGILATKPISINRTSNEWHKLSASQRDDLLRKNEITLITGSTITVRVIKEELSARAQKLMALLAVNKYSQPNKEPYAEDLTEDETDVQ